MGFKFELISPDRDNLGGFESAVPNWQLGETLIAAGNVTYKVVSVIPLERISEFVDEPLNGVIAVEPV
jgi:hypothetical protein